MSHWTGFSTNVITLSNNIKDPTIIKCLYFQHDAAVHRYITIQSRVIVCWPTACVPSSYRSNCSSSVKNPAHRTAGPNDSCVRRCNADCARRVNNTPPPLFDESPPSIRFVLCCCAHVASPRKSWLQPARWVPYTAATALRPSATDARTYTVIKFIHTSIKPPDKH